MADLFRCDKCGKVYPPTQKRGRLILQELRNGQPHVAQYNRQAEVCEPCFAGLQGLMKQTANSELAPTELYIIAKGVEP